MTAQHSTESKMNAGSDKQPDPRKLSIHHIGARRGTGEFPVMRQFDQDVIGVFYDADEEAMVQIGQANQERACEWHVLPYCFSDKVGPAHFNLNFNLYTSSLMEGNPDYGSFYQHIKGTDFIVSEITKTMEKRPVETVTMDSVCGDSTNKLPPPDFLSIDTQGSEYNILQGARQTLKDNVLGLVIEVELHEFYKDQKLFGNISDLLANQGFYFSRFLHLAELSPSRAPIGLRGDGFHFNSDALFLRRADVIDQSDPQLHQIMLKKLAFISIVFGQFEYGLSCLSQAKMAMAFTDEPGSPAYSRMLLELDQAARRMPQVYPKSYAERHDFDDLRARFKDSGEFVKVPGIKGKILRTPVMGPMASRAKTLVVRSFRTFRSGINRSSPVESVLTKYELHDLADSLKKTRRSQAGLI